MQQMVKCLNCGMENPAVQQFCGKCGAKLATELSQQQKIKCSNCGAQNLAGQQFCGNCGAKLAAIAPSAVPGVAASPVSQGQQVKVKPTWGLAWGLWWRTVVLSLLIGGLIYLIVFLVMVVGLGFNLKLPFGT
jgi:DNA-directed RNA polymerase subunit RPC12/RpoP